MRPTFRLLQVWLALFTASLVVFAPSLCLAGWIRHACDCEKVAECCECSAADAQGDGGARDGCSHDGCAKDPCQTRLTTSAPGRMAFDASPCRLSGPVFLLSSTALPAVLGTRSLTRLGHSLLGPPGVKRLPRHPAELPLLR